MKKRNLFISLLILIIVLILYSFFLKDTFSNLPWETYNTWRQSDTYSIGYLFIENGFDIFRPEFFYDGNGGNIVQLELQILPALGYKVFNFSNIELHTVMRLVSYSFFIGSSIFLFLLLRKFTSNISSIIATIIYLFIPLSILMARSILPETIVLFSYIGALLFFYKWYVEDSRISLYVSAIFISIAIIEKIPAAFLGLGIIYLYLDKKGKKSFKDIDFYLYGIIALLPSIIYFLYMGSVSSHSFVSGIATKHIFSEKLLNIFNDETFEFYKNMAENYLTYVVLIPSGLGLLKIFNLENKNRKFILAWFISIALETLFIVSIIKFEYYLIFVLPIISASIALFLEIFGKKSIFSNSLKIILGGIILFFLLNGVDEYRDYWLTDNEAIKNIGEIVHDNTDEDSYIGFNVEDPSVINSSRRYGARIGIDYFEDVPNKPKDELRFFINKDMTHVALLKYHEKYNEFHELLKDNELIYEDGIFEFYKLDEVK